MSKRKNWLLLLVLVSIAAFAVCLFSACGGAKYNVTWDVSEKATVTVTGFKALPSQVEEEKNLSFKVDAAEGYEVTLVSINDKSVTADNSGNYSTVVKSDIKIKVETAEKIVSVKVKTNPDKLTYYVGETLDTTGMVVEVEYGTGRTAAETDYSIVYKNGNAFAEGDTSFSVKFKGVESEAVNLTAAVEVETDEGVFVMAGWGRFITEEKFNKYVEGFKAYCDTNNIEYTSISGTYYPGKTNGTDPYFGIANFTAKVVQDGDVDVIIACADNIGGANANNDSQVKDMVVEKKAIDVKGQTNRLVATLNTCDLNTAFLAYVDTDVAKAILAE